MKKLLFILMLIPFLSVGQTKIRNTQITSGSQPANKVMKSDGATNVNWGNDSLTVKLPFVEFTEGGNQVHSPYKLFADTTNHTLAFYNDEEHVTMQVGQEMWSRIYNDGLVTIANGTVVRITGSFGGIATISLASNDYHINADGVLGVLTHDVESNTYGFVTTMGEVHELPTSDCPEGAIIYLGVNGAYTHVRPLAPNFVVEIGTCLYSHATDGTILVNIKGSPYDIVHNSFNDIFLESMKFTVTSNGTTTTGSIQRNGGGDLTMQFSSGFSTLDCTPAATVTLTAGTAIVPQTNYVYVPKSTGVLTASTSGWPSDEHIKVSEVACRTSALTQSDGVLRNQNWNDHIAGSNGSGHISHINERIRRLNADWFSGVTPTFTIVSASTPDNLYFSNTGGKVYQMHLQDFTAMSMPTADIHIVNHFTTPFVTTTNLNTQLTDATGATMASKSYSLVIWGIQNETGELSHLMCNLPIGSYLSAVNAIQDADNYSVYTIPNQFKGVGFLIARVTLSHNPASSGTWTLEQVQDLRGYFPNNTAGSGSSGSGGGVTTYLQLTDTPNSYASSANKLQGINSGETAIESKGVTATLEGTVNIPTGQQYQINGGSIVVDAINDGVTTTAPSQNAIYDALALKAPASGSANYIQNGTSTQTGNYNLTGNGVLGSTIQATTAKLTNLTPGFMPVHIDDASGLGNSPIYTDGTNAKVKGVDVYNEIGFDLSTYAYPKIQLSALGSFVGYDLNGSERMVLNSRFTGSHYEFQIAGSEKVRIESDGLLNAKNRLSVNNTNSVGILSVGALSTGWLGNGVDMAVKLTNTNYGVLWEASDDESVLTLKSQTDFFTFGTSYANTGSYRGINITPSGNKNIVLQFSGSGNVGIGYSTGTEITNNKFAVNGGGYFNGTVNSTGYLLNGNNLFSSLSSNVITKWDGTKFVDSGIPVFNYTVQSLSGTNVTWNLANGKDATITLTGNTVITLSNAINGMSGTLWVTNPSTVYTITFAGYVNSIDPFIRLNSNIVITSGGSKFDDYTFKYNGTKMNWNGTLDRH